MAHTCLKCGFDDHVDDAEFCQNCGTMVDGNYCTNEGIYL